MAIAATGLCVFCHEDSGTGGEMLTEGDLVVHQYCLVRDKAVEVEVKLYQ